jgi:hypothetical protein
MKGPRGVPRVPEPHETQQAPTQRNHPCQRVRKLFQGYLTPPLQHDSRIKKDPYAYRILARKTEEQAYGLGSFPVSPRCLQGVTSTVRPFQGYVQFGSRLEMSSCHTEGGRGEGCQNTNGHPHVSLRMAVKAREARRMHESLSL